MCVGLEADTVDALVDFRPLVIPTLAGTGHLELHAGRVPRTDASYLTNQCSATHREDQMNKEAWTGGGCVAYLSESSVGLAWEAGDAPAGHHALVALALRHTYTGVEFHVMCVHPSVVPSVLVVCGLRTDDVDHVVFVEDGIHRDGLLKQTGDELNLTHTHITSAHRGVRLPLCDVRPHPNMLADLVCDVASAVDLYLSDVGLLLSGLCESWLCVHEGADDGAVLGDALELGVHLVVLLVTLGILGVRLLLRTIPTQHSTTQHDTITDVSR